MIIEKALIKECLNDNRKAQFKLYKVCYGILMSVCLRYEKNKEDAEEMLNVGFLKIVTNLEKYDNQVPFEAWIRRIMMNTIIDAYRRNKKDREHIEYTDFEEPHFEKERLSYNQAQLDFDAEELLEMIRELPETTGKVFNMHVIEGYSHKEIAAQLNMSAGTSKWHVSHARKELKKKIESIVEPQQDESKTA